MLKYFLPAIILFAIMVVALVSMFLVVRSDRSKGFLSAIALCCFLSIMGYFLFGVKYVVQDYDLAYHDGYRDGYNDCMEIYYWDSE